MKWIIIVVMTTFSPDGYDAIKISKSEDEPLYFETKRNCLNYVKTHYVDLSIFALAQFKQKKEIDDIYCVPRLASI